MNALLSENYFFLTAMDPSAMMYAKAFKWVLEDRPYVGCEFRSLSLSLSIRSLSPFKLCVCARASFVPDSSFTPVSFS